MMKRLSTVQAVSILLCLVISAPSVSFSRTGTKADGAGKTLQNLPGDTLHIVVAGDLLLDRGVRQRIAQVGVDGLFTPSIDSLFLASDYVIANLECPNASSSGVNRNGFRHCTGTASRTWTWPTTTVSTRAGTD